MLYFNYVVLFLFLFLSVSNDLAAVVVALTGINDSVTIHPQGHKPTNIYMENILV